MLGQLWSMICGRKKRYRPTAEPSQDSAACAKALGLRALKKMGLTDDEDVKVMIKGSQLWKIKSRTWRKQRLYRLEQDGMTIWFESPSKRSRSKQTFSVIHIHDVWEGFQSEGLRHYGLSFPEKHCFTIVFKGKRKNLDMAADSEDEAQRWIQGLKKLIKRVDAMSQREKLDHWIRDYLNQADKNKDDKMTFKEIKNMLKMINIEMNDIYALRLFKKCDRSNNNKLEEHELEEFCTLLMQRPELEEIFSHYSGEDRVLSAEELLDFLQDQGEAATLENACRIIQTYELSEKAKFHNLMMLDGFIMYLLSPEGNIFNHEHAQVYQDMNQPLSHYFISSSHNTYLTENQLGGASSTEAYIRAFMGGCRCVELDCWEGSGGEPIIYHGHTLTSKILFRDVIRTIRDHAFKHSPYPVILSIENHCGLEQQTTMARHLKNILGNMLVTKTLDDKVPTELPSPQQLKGKILVKGKKLQFLKNGGSGWNASEEEEEYEEEQELRSQTPRRMSQFEMGQLQPKDSSEISVELSDVVVYCKTVRFHGFGKSQAANEMSSFSERKVRRLIKDSGNAFVRHSICQLSRIYPSGLRTDSSNYNPQEMWNAGCQLVALNFQTPGYEMDLNQGRFQENGNCGYILKPPFMRDINTKFNPEYPSRGSSHDVKTLSVKVISAQQLPKLNKEKKNSIVDPLVHVEVYGVSMDNARKHTKYILNNGFNPRWNETLTHHVRVPQLALVRFVVEDYDTTSSNDFVGQYTLPFMSLKAGYRHIHLLSKDGTSLSPATLFVHITIERL
ncbi:1-phosphatidylinositol 4,5-bisphosphate phosphodiesterase delta-3 [Rhinatrema bivittatum]|uniref:1-phosphatidylinositol 4,5-bisphosphate phosphodiesterase delta-3 n=1 Tax=Rhinatrema bivittatum TaxID=194408 RepID=UPI00112E15A4|nr:1-phosphatidylinositol 4,5-bisphosphate phosphodiesterase delta-3 [Rhinatrema bivittatum]